MGAKRFWGATVIATLTAAVLVAGAGGASAGSDEEQGFVARINAERSERGLEALAVRPDLVAVARRHSERMLDAGAIYHNPDLAGEVGGDWTMLGENVGVGSEVDSLHQAFMDSPSHRANVLRRGFNEIGVGVVIADDGTIYVTEVFARRGPATKRIRRVTEPSRGTPARASAAPRPHPHPARRSASEATPQTVDLLVRMIALDADGGTP